MPYSFYLITIKYHRNCWNLKRHQRTFTFINSWARSGSFLPAWIKHEQLKSREIKKKQTKVYSNFSPVRSLLTVSLKQQARKISQSNKLTLFFLTCSLSVPGSLCIDDRPLKTSSEKKRCRTERKTGGGLVLVKGQTRLSHFLTHIHQPAEHWVVWKVS